MEKTTTNILSLASLVFGVLFAILAIALLGTPVTDIGMLSTTLVFVLLGGVGLALGKAQAQD